jgi:hypothetical protein
LAEHSDVGLRLLDTAVHNKYKDVNTAMQKALAQLRAEGVHHLFVLSAADIDFDLDCTVDGSHPNDLGMRRYAEAYEKCGHLPVEGQACGGIRADQTNTPKDRFPWQLDNALLGRKAG